MINAEQLFGARDYSGRNRCDCSYESHLRQIFDEERVVECLSRARMIAENKVHSADVKTALMSELVDMYQWYSENDVVGIVLARVNDFS